MAKPLPLSHRFQSTRVDTGRYDPKKDIISVVFTDGVAWRYRNCDERTWREFMAAGSPGRYIAEVLDRHPNGPG